MTQFVIIQNGTLIANHTVDIEDVAAAEALAEGNIGYANGTFTVQTKAAWEADNAAALTAAIEANRVVAVKSLVIGTIKRATLPTPVFNLLSGAQQTELDTYHTDLWALRNSLSDLDALVLPTRPTFI